MLIAALLLLSAAPQGPTGIDVADLGGGCGWPGTVRLSVSYSDGGACGAATIALCSEYLSLWGEFGYLHECLGSVFVLGSSTTSIDLSALGGCDLLVLPEVLLAVHPGKSVHCDGAPCVAGVGKGLACGTSASFAIPCDPTLVGASVFAQVATVYFTDAALPSVELTNAVAITLT
jgi:hypothetical protein